MAKIVVVHNLAETEALGRRLGAALFPGAVVALVGQLGAGKTHLVRAIAQGLEIKHADTVTSPTFVLIQEYDARLPIFHFDSYRLGSEAEFAELGFDEYATAGGVCLIEWADKVQRVLPREHLEIRITIVGEESRQIELFAHGANYAAVGEMFP